MTAIDKLINIAQGEVGYLEKKSNAQLDDRTANAGQGNYTKYWRDIKPEFQGEPWCACFVTWCFEKAFGRQKAETLLRHYPYTYCPTMASLFTLHSEPQRGDIVIFKHGGTFTHTGIVTGVNGDKFSTIEGNTSGGSTIIANGGGVCSKSYYNSNLPGTKFCRPDYSIAEGDELTVTQYEEIDARLRELNSMIVGLQNTINTVGQEITALFERTKRYKTINDVPDWYRGSIQKCIDQGLIQGDQNGDLNITDDVARILTILDRAGKI